MRVGDEYNLCKTNKTTKKEINNILINIWFNYFFFSCFCSKMLSWSCTFFLVYLVLNFEQLMQFGHFH